MAENGKRKHSDDEVDDDANTLKKAKSSKEAGVLLFSGLSDYSLRHEPPNKNESLMWSAMQFKSVEDVRFTDVSSGPASYFTLAISDEGTVYSWGFNEKGQLGLGDFQNRRNPTIVEKMSGHNVVQVATGRQHGLMVTDEGHVYACGDNKNGQCGIGSLKKDCISTPMKIDISKRIKMAACGDEFSLLLSEDGKLYSFGTPENGVLGHGEEKKEIVKRQLVFTPQTSPLEIELFVEIADGETVSHGQPNITYIAAGSLHACAIDDSQRLFTWGFGGYGRLGHDDTRNEMRPRLLKCWYRITGRADGGVTKVWCGGQFNIVDTIVDKCKYMFGQFNRNSEANMYPKFLDDLQGWNTRHICCSQFGYTICADDAVIGSQPSPGYGTLAMGEKKKASAQPMILTSFKDVYCLRAGLGYMHACFIIREQSEKDKEALKQFPVMDLEDSPAAAAEEEEPVGKKGKKGKAIAVKTNTKAKGKTGSKKK